MAGHSKWANIQHRKKAQDAKRGKLFTKLIREITVASRMANGDESSPRVRAAIDAGLACNMPKDTIERAVKRGAGSTDGADVEEIRYEGYAPGGIAVMVDCMSDNRNRTVGEVRHAFTKCGGNLGTDGSVAYLFKKIGLLIYSATADEEKLMEAALEAGAEDIESMDGEGFEIETAPENFSDVKKALEDAGFKAEMAEITMQPATEIDVQDAVSAEKILKLIDMLEDLDDVQKVYTNANIDASLMGEL